MKHNQLPFMLIIYGPTGVGKTDLSLEIAENLPAEIINMDVGQFYTPLSVGTAKPHWKESPIPHHLFDIIDEPKNFSVSEYRKILYEKVNEITARKKLPILVGGSGFYLYALLYFQTPYSNSIYMGNHIEDSSKIEIVRTPIKSHEISLDSWQKLYSIDPQRAMAIEKNDIYRIERALNIWKLTGTLPSSYKPEYCPQADYSIIFIERERQELKDRINARVIEMFNNGWIEEAQSLMNTPWRPFLKKKNLIGYNEIFDYLSEKKTENDFQRMIQTIQAKTRQYAKRQFTFWRKLEREIKKENQYTSMYVGCVESVNISDPQRMLYSKELIKQLLSRWRNNE